MAAVAAAPVVEVAPALAVLAGVALAAAALGEAGKFFEFVEGDFIQRGPEE